MIGWSTGNGTIVNNKQAPYYPNATIYAPQTPDPASYNSTVSLVPMFAQSWNVEFWLRWRVRHLNSPRWLAKILCVCLSLPLE